VKLVIFPQNLYLDNVQLKDGSLVSGEVINGAWKWILNHNYGIEEAWDSFSVRNSWKHEGFTKIVYVPRNLNNHDYNHVLQWAESQEDCSSNLEELHDIDEIDKINHKRYHDDFDDDIDDDIAF
jgi:hypothetical protein